MGDFQKILSEVKALELRAEVLKPIKRILLSKANEEGYRYSKTLQEFEEKQEGVTHNKDLILRLQKVSTPEALIEWEQQVRDSSTMSEEEKESMIVLASNHKSNV